MKGFGTYSHSWSPSIPIFLAYCAYCVARVCTSQALVLAHAMDDPAFAAAAATPVQRWVIYMLLRFSTLELPCDCVHVHNIYPNYESSIYGEFIHKHLAATLRRIVHLGGTAHGLERDYIPIVVFKVVAAA